MSSAEAGDPLYTALHLTFRFALASLARLQKSAKHVKTPAPSKSNPATWGAPPTTKNGRKPLFKFSKKPEDLARRRSNSWENKLEINQVNYAQVRQERFELAKERFSSEGIAFPDAELTSILADASTDDSFSALFTQKLDTYSLTVFSQMSVFDEVSAGYTNDDATNKT